MVCNANTKHTHPYANLKKGKITSCRECIECFTVLIQCSEDMPSASSFPAHVRISKLKRDLTCEVGGVWAG